MCFHPLLNLKSLYFSNVFVGPLKQFSRLKNPKFFALAQMLYRALLIFKSLNFEMYSKFLGKREQKRNTHKDKQNPSLCTYPLSPSHTVWVLGSMKHFSHSKKRENFLVLIKGARELFLAHKFCFALTF